MIDGARPQDVDRPHRRRGAPSIETRTLLGRGQAAMRSEVTAILDALEATTAPGLLPDARLTLVIPLDDPKRDRLWDRGLKILRELGSAIDADPVPVKTSTSSPKARRRRVEYG